MYRSKKTGSHVAGITVIQVVIGLVHPAVVQAIHPVIGEPAGVVMYGLREAGAMKEAEGIDLLIA